jgi:hypothetical protein
MTRYRYVTELTPPAPFVTVSLRCPSTGRQAEGLPAQVDTAADRTVVPDGIITTLGLVPDGRAVFQGFGGQLLELPIFLVALILLDCPPVLARVALGQGEPYILLGRDVLNTQRILLDGPGLAVEIG